MWVHLGGLGPKRVDLPADGAMPAPPYRLIDNVYTHHPPTAVARSLALAAYS